LSKTKAHYQVDNLRSLKVFYFRGYYLTFSSSFLKTNYPIFIPATCPSSTPGGECRRSAVGAVGGGFAEGTQGS
jgi:hypothetical protein